MVTLATHSELVTSCMRQLAVVDDVLSTSYTSWNGLPQIKIMCPNSNTTVFNTNNQGGLRTFITHFRQSSIFKNLPTLMRDASIAPGFRAKEQLVDELLRDFTTHWVEGFISLTNKAALLERVANPLTCVSPATVVAMNMYLSHLPMDKKELMKASKYTWIVRKSMLVPTMFYSTFETQTVLEKANPYLFPTHLGMYTTIRSLRSVIGGLLQDDIDRSRNQEAMLRLLAHNAKATDYFQFKQEDKKKHTTFLGVELELDHFTEASRKALDTLEGHAILKRDGSVSNGVEICTRPATLSIHKEEFLKFFSEAHELRAEANCGLHVHIDKRTLTKLHLANIHMFMNSDANNTKIETIAGRQANSYCSRYKLEYYNFINETRPHPERYSRVNYCNTDTIEFRLFASTISFEDFCKRLEFTQAVVDYTKPGSANVSVKELGNWGHFQTYVSKNNGLYPTLSKEF